MRLMSDSFKAKGKIMNVEEQVRIIEAQIHSKRANFTLEEKMIYMTSFFGNDPEYSKEAFDIVRSNICRKLCQGRVNTLDG